MDELQQLCATPLEICVDGKPYRLGRLTLAAYAQLEAWARRLPFAELEGKLAEIKDRKLRERAEARLLEDAVTASNDPARVARMLGTLAADRYLFALLIHAEQPAMKQEEIDKLLDLAGTRKIRAWIDEVVRSGAAGGAPAENPPRAGAQ